MHYNLVIDKDYSLRSRVKTETHNKHSTYIKIKCIYECTYVENQPTGVIYKPQNIAILLCLPCPRFILSHIFYGM